MSVHSILMEENPKNGDDLLLDLLEGIKKEELQEMNNLKRIKIIMKLALPIIVANVSYILWQLITVIFLGKIADSTTFAALGNRYKNHFL